MFQELQDYIAQARKKGFSDKDIYDQLVEAGWTKIQISQALGLSIPNNQQTDEQNNSTFFKIYKQSKLLQFIFLIFRLCVLVIAVSPFLLLLFFSTGTLYNSFPGVLLYLLFGINFFLIAVINMNPIGFLLLIPYVIIAWFTVESIYDESQGKSPIPMKIIKNDGVRAIGLFIACIIVITIISLAIFTFFAMQNLNF